MRRLLLAGLALIAAAVPAFAHGGGAAHEVGWTWDASIIVPLALAAILYAVGFARLWRRGVRGRHARLSGAALFAAGWMVLAFALVSPLHAWGELMLTAHMIEHEAMMIVAAPLLVLARPGPVLLWGLPRFGRRAVAATLRAGAVAGPWRVVSTPFVATIIHAVAIWVWHAPPLFTAALTNEAVHWLQHLCFFGSALLFWWAVTQTKSYGAAISDLFVTTLHTGFLGVLMLVSGRVWYPAQLTDAAHWGLTLIEDQQLAGLIMWIPGGMVYVVAALWLAGIWISSAGRSAQARGGYGAGLG